MKRVPRGTIAVEVCIVSLFAVRTRTWQRVWGECAPLDAGRDSGLSFSFAADPVEKILMQVPSRPPLQVMKAEIRS